MSGVAKMMEGDLSVILFLQASLHVVLAILTLLFVSLEVLTLFISRTAYYEDIHVVFSQWKSFTHHLNKNISTTLLWQHFSFYNFICYNSLRILTIHVHIKNTKNTWVKIQIEMNIHWIERRKSVTTRSNKVKTRSNVFYTFDKVEVHKHRVKIHKILAKIKTIKEQ